MVFMYLIFFYACLRQTFPALTIGGTVLKESDDLAILGVTFD